MLKKHYAHVEDIHGVAVTTARVLNSHHIVGRKAQWDVVGCQCAMAWDVVHNESCRFNRGPRAYVLEAYMPTVPVSPALVFPLKSKEEHLVCI